MHTLLLSIVILIIGYSFDSSLAFLWWSLAIIVWVPPSIVFWGLIFGIVYIIFL